MLTNHSVVPTDALQVFSGLGHTHINIPEKMLSATVICMHRLLAVEPEVWSSCPEDEFILCDL